MKILSTYEDRDEAEEAALRIEGAKRLASERDGTVVIYNLFGKPTWGNLYRLDLYNLGELNELLKRRDIWRAEDAERHKEIIASLFFVAKKYDTIIPKHWL